MTTRDYNACVDAHADGVYRFILHNTRDKEFAQDIVQDAFEKMWIHVENIQADKAKSYLFTTAYHTMLDKLRRTRRQGNWDEVREEAVSHQQEHYSGIREILREALDKLPEVQRTVVLLRDYEGYTYEEIGEITGLTPPQVKVYIYRARLSLKNYIGKAENII